MDQDKLEEELVIVDEARGQVITLPRRGNQTASVVSAERLDGEWFAIDSIEAEIVERIDAEREPPWQPVLWEGCGGGRARLIRRLWRF